MTTATTSAEEASNGRLMSFISRRFGRFFIVRRIAEGGFGEVYEGADVFSGVRYAVKIPHVDDERALYDYYREIAIVRELEHSNVVPVLYAEVIADTPTLVYPLGVASIADRIEEGLWTSEALDFGAQLLDGLAHVHARGYLHCDLKPGNLIVFEDGTLGLSDFGLARDITDAEEHTTSGTAEYMAPEHHDGYVSTRSDVYEAALVIVEMLTGDLPENPSEVAVGELLPDVYWAHALAPVLQKALEPEPEKRYADAGEFARAYDAVIRRRAAA